PSRGTCGPTLCRSRERVAWLAADGIGDQGEGRLQVRLHKSGVEADECEAERFQHVLAFGVCLGGGIVDASIDLDYEFFGRAIEVPHEAPDWVWARELEAAESPVSKGAPKPAL